jgi:hypothetical protein
MKPQGHIADEKSDLRGVCFVKTFSGVDELGSRSIARERRSQRCVLFSIVWAYANE